MTQRDDAFCRTFGLGYGERGCDLAFYECQICGAAVAAWPSTETHVEWHRSNGDLDEEDE